MSVVVKSGVGRLCVQVSAWNDIMYLFTNGVD